MSSKAGFARLFLWCFKGITQSLAAVREITYNILSDRARSRSISADGSSVVSVKVLSDNSLSLRYVLSGDRVSVRGLLC